MPTSCIPPSPLPPRSIRQLKERVANLRVKHDQIYNFPLQHIEPQVNWSTVIEEKQVPGGHQCQWPVVPVLPPVLASSTSWAGTLVAPHGEAGSWETSGQLHTGSSKELGGRGGAGVMGQGWLLWHPESVLEVAPVLASASPVTTCFSLYSTALIFYFIPLPTLFQPEKGSTPQTGFPIAALQHR